MAHAVPIARRAALLLLCMALLASAAGPAPAHHRQSYPEAMRWYVEEALAGNAQAQYLLGFSFERGVRVEIDLAEARGWYREAARGGHERAQLRLALMLLDGAGGPADAGEAARWLEAAALQGATDAMSMLGYLLATADPPDTIAAFRWFSLAAEAGDGAAAANLEALSRAMSETALAEARAALEAWRETR